VYAAAAAGRVSGDVKEAACRVRPAADLDLVAVRRGPERAAQVASTTRDATPLQIPNRRV
jgi:hypothetical protein